MLNYGEIKTKLTENKTQIVLGVCFILVFLVGFGTGSYDREARKNSYKPQTNYTTPTAKQPSPAAGNQPNTAGQGAVLGATASAATTNCIVKGNISATGKKIYHVVGGAFYKIVKPEQCFNTEAEALAAGFVKSSRWQVRLKSL